MPSIKALADRAWDFGGKPLRFRRTKDLPDFIASNFDVNFQRAAIPCFRPEAGSIIVPGTAP
jgi:hypothetical protein